MSLLQYCDCCSNEGQSGPNKLPLSRRQIERDLCANLFKLLAFCFMPSRCRKLHKKETLDSSGRKLETSYVEIQGTG